MRQIFTATLILIVGIAIGSTITKPTSAQDPCGSSFKIATYLEDVEVIKTVEHERMTVSEIMDILDRQPNVRTVSLHVDPPRRFSLDTLAYPQYAHRYELTKGEWADLQAYVKLRLKEGLAVDSVIDHWKLIAGGTPPFGLRVQH